jgi:hypothetical protein
MATPEEKPKTAKDTVREHLDAFKEKLKEPKANLTDLMEDLSKVISSKGGLAEFKLDIMPGVLLDNATEVIKTLWHDTVRELFKKYKDDPVELHRKLKEAAKPLSDRIEETAKMVTGYIKKVTKYSKGGQITEEVLLEIEKHAAALGEILSDIENNEEALYAIKYVFEKESKVSRNRERVYDYLESIFDTDCIQKFVKINPYHTQGEIPVAWVIVRYLTTDEKQEFIDRMESEYGSDSLEFKMFLAAGCLSGAISVNQVTDNAEFSEEETQELAEVYKQQNDFMKAAEELRARSYGSENPVNSMLSLRSILILVMQIAGGISAGGTLLAGIFKGGALKSPANLLRTLKSKAIWTGGGMIALGEYLKNPTPGLFTSKEEREGHAKKETGKYLVDLRNNPGLREFLETNDDEGRSGAVLFGRFITTYCKKDSKGKDLDEPSPKKLNLAKFSEWMKKNYPDSASQITVADNKYKINDYDINNYDIGRLGLAFHIWNIGEKSTQTQYSSAIKLADGYMP